MASSCSRPFEKRCFFVMFALHIDHSRFAFKSRCYKWKVPVNGYMSAIHFFIQLTDCLSVVSFQKCLK